MLACIPTNGNAGTEDSVCDHFGSAPYFTLYDTATDATTVLENRNAHHSHGTCHHMNQLARYHIDCIVCSGMGRRAIEALNSEGIRTYHSTSSKVSDVIDQIKAENLTEMNPDKACRGHGQKANVIKLDIDDRPSGRGQGRGAGFGRGGNRGGGRGGNSGRGRRSS